MLAFQSNSVFGSSVLCLVSSFCLLEVFVFQVFLYSVLLLVIARLLGGIEVTNYGQALLAAFVLSVLNVLIRPILIILTAPILLLTLGLFLWVINAWLLKQ